MTFAELFATAAAKTNVESPDKERYLFAHVIAIPDCFKSRQSHGRRVQKTSSRILEPPAAMR